MSPPVPLFSLPTLPYTQQKWGTGMERGRQKRELRRRPKAEDDGGGDPFPPKAVDELRRWLRRRLRVSGSWVMKGMLFLFVSAECDERLCFSKSKVFWSSRRTSPCCIEASVKPVASSPPTTYRGAKPTGWLVGWLAGFNFLFSDLLALASFV